MANERCVLFHWYRFGLEHIYRFGEIESSMTGSGQWRTETVRFTEHSIFNCLRPSGEEGNEIK